MTSDVVGAVHTGRQVVLARRPVGRVAVPDDFTVREVEERLEEPGTMLVRNAFMSVDPAMHGRLGTSEKHYTTNFAEGAPLDGSAVGRVLESRDPRFRPGDWVRHRLGWRDLAVVPAETARTVDLSSAPATAWLSALGQPGLTAYAGLVRAGELRRGDRVLVSAAAGAVGSAAIQFARLLGAASVHGVVGSPDKQRFVVEELGADDCLVRPDGPLRRALAELVPDGIDLYFDNVGGHHLAAALDALAVHGRVVLCGMMSTYGGGDGVSLDRLMKAILKRLQLRGLIVRDHEDLRPEFEQRVGSWLASGELVVPQTVVDGLEAAPQALISLLAGGNTGKMLVRLDPDVER